MEHPTASAIVFAFEKLMVRFECKYSESWDSAIPVFSDSCKGVMSASFRRSESRHLPALYGIGASFESVQNVCAYYYSRGVCRKNGKYVDQLKSVKFFYRSLTFSGLPAPLDSTEICPHAVSFCYTHKRTIESAPQGWSAHPLQKGGEIVTVYEAISLMLTFGMLIIALLSFHKKK
jgi:hypothetical protein